MEVATFGQRDGITHIKVKVGRLDAAAAPSFKGAIERHLSDKPHRIIVDLRMVNFLDSTGLGVFVSMLKMMGQPGALALAGAGPAIRRLLEITQLDRVFQLFETPDDAHMALSG
jgi:anti-sigma B factor antagonist